MAIIRTNAQNQIAMWGEATFNTRPTPVSKGQRIPIIGHDLGRTQALATSRVLRGDPNLSQPPRGRYHNDGHKMSIPIERNMIGLLLYKMFPSYAVAGGADPYTHTFKLVAGAWHAAGPYFGCEIWDTEAGKGDVLDGNCILGLDCEVNTDDTEAMLTFTTAGTAKGTWEAGTREQASPTTYTDVLFNMADVILKVDTVQTTMVANAKFSISRKVSVRYVPDGNRYASVIVIGGIDKASVSLTGLFDDAATIKVLATGEAEHNIEFIFKHPTNANHKLSFLFPEVQCYLSNVPAVGSGNEREISIDGTAYYQDGGDASCVKVVLNNPLATYVGLMQ